MVKSNVQSIVFQNHHFDVLAIEDECWPIPFLLTFERNYLKVKDIWGYFMR